MSDALRRQRRLTAIDRGPSQSNHHATGCSATTTRGKRVSSFNRFFGFEFRFWKKFEFNIPTYRHNIFPSKQYMTYECIRELVVTVPSARSTIVKKIKRFIIWLYKWSRVTFTELLSTVVKIPWHYHQFPWLSMTFAIFHDFPGLESGLPKFHDFPWPGGTL